LHKFELADHEWEIVKQLQDVLKDTTLYFSHSTPNLATVIPAINHIDEKLTSYSRNKKYALSICTAVELAKKTFNRYYELTDSSEVYRITMVLHPCHKLSYFKAAHWEEDWIQTAKKLVCNTFDHSYLSADDDSNFGSIEELPHGKAEHAVHFFSSLILCSH
ncbi:hypothetical protein EV702DRAFT_971812, partial [Suillus placidus]